MPGKRRPLPKGFLDAQGISNEAKRRGIHLTAASVKWQFDQGKVGGVIPQSNHPQRRKIVPVGIAEGIIEAAGRKQALRGRGRRGELTTLSALATEVGLKEKSLHGRNIKTISDGRTRWVPAEEARRVRREYRRKKELEEGFISPAQAGREIGVAQQTIVKWIGRGLIPAKAVVVKRRNVHRIKRADWEAVRGDLKERAGYVPFGSRKMPKRAPARKAPEKTRAGPKREKRRVPEEREARGKATPRTIEAREGPGSVIGPKVERVERAMSAEERLAMIRQRHQNIQTNRRVFNRALSELDFVRAGDERWSKIQTEAEKHMGTDPAMFRSEVIPRLLKMLRGK